MIGAAGRVQRSWTAIVAWQSLELTVSGEVAQPLADALIEAGALSVSIEDADAGTSAEQARFGEPGTSAPDPWPHSRLLALFDATAPLHRLLPLAAQNCGLDACPSHRISTVEERDWVQQTQSQFAPIKVSERLWIVPSWHEAPDPRAINLLLDPGLAFGTGSHPTTRLCLEWLECHVRGGERVIDYGCGSGILAIAAAKLGAGHILGVDIDPVAVDAARANAHRNRVDGTFQDVSTPLHDTADLVLANILANPLRLLAPALARLTRGGGRVVLAGLLVDQQDEITAVYEPYFTMRPFAIREGWVALEGVRR